MIKEICQDWVASNNGKMGKRRSFYGSWSYGKNMCGLGSPSFF